MDIKNETINKESPLPIYWQLKNILKEKIERGEFKPGDRIPPEDELCKTFGISRTPIRQALAELVNEGLLLRRRGQGTFVSNSSRLQTITVIIPEQRWRPPLEQAKAVWNAENPDIPLNLEIIIAGYPQLRSKIITAVARGGAPDIALIDSAWMAEFAALDYLTPIDELDPKWAKQDFSHDFFPSFATSWFSGHLYGIPPEADIAVMWFRKDWFAKEGLKPPRDWDELIAISHHFKKPAVRKKYHLSRYPLAFPGGRRAGETTSYILLPLLWSAGEQVFTANGVKLGTGTKQVLSLLFELVYKYKAASPDVIFYEWNSSPILFGTGEVALSFGGSYEKSIICKAAGWNEKEFKQRADFTLFPSVPGGISVTLASGMVYSIFRQSKLAHVALEFIKRVVSKEIMEEFCRTTGQNPTRISVAQALDIDADWFLHKTSSFLYSARMRPPIPEYAVVSEQLQQMLENVLAKRMPVETAVKSAEQVITAVMSRKTDIKCARYNEGI